MKNASIWGRASLVMALGLGATACAVSSAPEESVGHEEGALSTQEVGVASSWNENDRVLGVQGEQGTIVVHVDPTTIYGIEDPNIFPVGECKNIATQWAASVKNGDSRSTFRMYLGWLVQHSCNVGFVRTSAPNAKGQFGLILIAPHP